MSQGDFSQTWINNSKDTFNLVEWDCSLDSILGTVHTSPGPTLGGVQSKQSLIWSQTASIIASGLTDGYIRWQAKNGKTVGINIHVPFQELMIGTAPCYQTAIDGAAFTGEYTSNPYTFDTTVVGYWINVTPRAEHTSLHLTITINDI